MLHRIRQIIGEDREIALLRGALNVLFQFHKLVYRAKNYNYPIGQYILALWHAHQCGLYSAQNRDKLNVMISNSRDGDIIAYATENLGIKTVRGSHQRGGAKATLEMLEVLKNGENGAITIDGPRGPKHIVKKGIIEIARLSGVPIVPMMWYCGVRGSLKFKTWDEFEYPIPFKRLINIYGEPIFVPKELDADGVEKYRKEVEDALLTLHKKAICEYNKLK